MLAKTRLALTCAVLAVTGSAIAFLWLHGYPLHAEPIHVVSSPKVVRVGEPVTIDLSDAATGELVTWLDGRMLGKQPFQSTSKPSFKLNQPGDYGIEVWIAQPDSGRKTEESRYLTVR